MPAYFRELISACFVKPTEKHKEVIKMLKPVFVAILLLILAFIFAACATVGLPSATVTPEPAAESGPAVMPARPGSGATGDPSANLHDLVDVAGVAKEVKEGLVLITREDGSDFMLRFSENTTWDEGVDQTIAVGNRIACQVKPEPTFTTPSQGEVYFVSGNEKP